MARPTMSSNLGARRSPSHVRKNRGGWDRYSDEYQAKHGPQLNRWGRAGWGTWSVPESRLQILGDPEGLDVLEFGCGAAQWSINLARRGARMVGMDLSGRQLEHARALIARTRASVPLVQANAERAPFADASFDVVFCDHGAMTFADPGRTVPEAARLLRPGGLFAFNIASLFHFLCYNAETEQVDDRLHVDAFGPLRAEEDDGVDFQLTYGEWIRLFRANDLVIEDLLELRPPQRARSTYDEYVSIEWARRWPAENLWVTRKLGGDAGGSRSA